MRISTCVVSSNEAPLYLDFYPLVRRLWQELVGIRCVLVLVADSIPDRLKPFADDILLSPPIDGVHTAFHAQCVRLLAPQLLNEPDGVLISDIDMLPMSRRYFIDTVSDCPADALAIYRGDDRARYSQEIPICYNAASSRTWGEVIAPVSSMGDVSEVLRGWRSAVEYSGVPGRDGWQTDQHILHDAVHKFDRSRVCWLRDWRTGFHRLGRPIREQGFNRLELRLARAGWYADHHLGRPMSEFSDLNEQIASAVLDGQEMPALLQGFLGLSVVRRIYAARVRARRAAAASGQAGR